MAVNINIKDIINMVAYHIIKIRLMQFLNNNQYGFRSNMQLTDS